MHMAYGIKDEKYIDDLVKLSESQIIGLTAAVVPGRFLVNTLPLLRFVPSWCPGAGWKGFFKNLADMNEQMTVRPFEDAKRRIVRDFHLLHVGLQAELLHLAGRTG
jgi:hypothetical protein